MTGSKFGGAAGAAALFLLLVAAGPALARTVVDAAGRTVNVPDVVKHVLPAGPPADLLIYSVAPDELVGMVKPWSADTKAFVPDAYKGLAGVPRVNRDMTAAQLQAVKDLKPDLIVDYGDVTPGYAATADAIQSLTGIPYVLINGGVAMTPAAFRMTGTLLGKTDRGEQLATFADQTLARVAAASAGATGAKTIYYARGDDALQAVAPNNVNGEVANDAGGKAVVPAGSDTFVTVTADQIKGWAPQLGVVGSAKAATALAAILPAGTRVVVDPSVPLPWVENPPSVNRLVGLLWYGSLLHPDKLSLTAADYQAAWKTLFGFDVPADAITARLKP